MNIYLDESGDLGWSFDSPYRQGGSSRHLTTASLVVSPQKAHLPKRLIKKLYQKFGWPPAVEKKWSDMELAERVEFAEKAKALKERNPDDIRFLSITVRKENVQAHIRGDSNKLYNYMIGLSLLEEMSCHEQVCFIPDPRSIKVASGNSLHDYLQTQLWFDKGAPTILTTLPCDSAASKGVQFADMLSGLVQSHFEDGNSDSWRAIQGCLDYKRLFF